MNIEIKHATADELDTGYAVCECKEFAHVLRACAMQTIPPDYSGELCPRCGLWMCAVDKLLHPQAARGEKTFVA